MAELEKERDAKLAEKVLALDKLKATSDQALKLQREELALARSFETRWKAAEERLTGLNKELASSKEALAAANGNVGRSAPGKRRWKPRSSASARQRTTASPGSR